MEALVCVPSHSHTWLTSGDPEMNGMQTIAVRQRSRKACEPCRERKRKCPGGQPCDMCRNFGYSCHYRAVPRTRQSREQKAAKKRSLSVTHETHQSAEVSNANTQHSQQDKSSFKQSLDSNSGSTFVRTFAMTVDATNALPLSMLGWNLFLGQRHVPLTTLPRDITDVISQKDMQNLASAYIERVDPCYGFVDIEKLHRTIQSRWPTTQDVCSLYDAVLCSVAAIGCLFSTFTDLHTETLLFALAKSLLDFAVIEEASVDIATAWVLRTVYLRLTAKPDEAWMASSTALHIIDAAGLHFEADTNVALKRPAQGVDQEMRRRIFGVARHLNLWLSYDLGRSRVTLHNASSILPSQRPSDYTTELLELLPYTESLDPEKALSEPELLSTFSAVIARTHSQPPSVLAQCNLMLCLYRRLYTLGYHVPDEILEKAVALIQLGIQAVYANIENSSPWHHLANVPFQSICTLLAIDTVQSFTVLRDAMACLENVWQTYRTQTTKDAVTAGQVLIYMHQRQRETNVKRQSEMLKLYPSPQPAYEATFENFPLDQAFLDLPWFNDLIPNEDFQTLGDGQLFDTW